jgi:hypothetical protein
MFNIHKMRGTNYSPFFLRQLYNQHHPQGLEKFFWFCFGNMAYCVGGVVPNLKHNKPSLPSVVNPCTNIVQSEVNALGQTRFVLVQGAPLVTLTTKFNELCILPRVSPNVQNGHKICVRQRLLMKMSRMKDLVTLDGKVFNITFTPQGHTYIYEILVHESIFNNLPCTYFVTIGVYPSCTCPYFVSNAQ